MYNKTIFWFTNKNVNVWLCSLVVRSGTYSLFDTDSEDEEEETREEKREEEPPKKKTAFQVELCTTVSTLLIFFFFGISFRPNRTFVEF